MDEAELLRRLNALAETPTPDAERALERTRAALLAEPKSSPSFWSVRTMSGVAVSIASSVSTFHDCQRKSSFSVDIADLFSDPSPSQLWQWVQCPGMQ